MQRFGHSTDWLQLAVEFLHQTCLAEMRVVGEQSSKRTLEARKPKMPPPERKIACKNQRRNPPASILVLAHGVHGKPRISAAFKRAWSLVEMRLDPTSHRCLVSVYYFDPRMSSVGQRSFVGVQRQLQVTLPGLSSVITFPNNGTMNSHGRNGLEAGRCFFRFTSCL